MRIVFFILIFLSFSLAKDACLIRGEELLKQAIATESKKAISKGLAASILFRKECEKGKIKCCDKFAQNYLLYYIYSKNIKEDLRLLEKACKKGSVYSCYMASNLYSQKLQRKNQIINKNIEKAIKLAKKGCEERLKDSCNLYYTLSFIHTKNNEFLNKIKSLCYKRFFKSCFNGARFYANGIIVKKDVSKAKKLLEYACNKKNGKACFELSLLIYKYGNRKDPKTEKEIIDLLKKACSIGYKKACNIYQKKGGKK